MATDKRTFELKLIHIGKSSLQLDEASYRALLEGVTGKSSAAQLTEAERSAVLKRMAALGFLVKPRGSQPNPGALVREAQLRKLRAMWYALADVGAVERPASADACNACVEAWARTRLHELSALRFASGHQMSELIEQMKAWGDRVGAEVHRATPVGTVSHDAPVASSSTGA